MYSSDGLKKYHQVSLTLSFGLMATLLHGINGSPSGKPYYSNIVMNPDGNNQLGDNIGTLPFGFSIDHIGHLSGQLALNPICKSDGCIRKAGQLVTYMDRTVNPCDNFYDFACGNFERDLALHFGDSQSNWLVMLGDKLERDKLRIIERLIKFDNSWVKNTHEPKFFQKMRQCFISCQDTGNLDALGLEPMKKVIADMKGWPVLGNTSAISKQEIVKALAKAGFTYQNIIYLFPWHYDIDSASKVLGVISPYSAYLVDKKEKDATVQSLQLKSCLTGGPAPTAVRFAVELAVLFGADREQAEIQMQQVAEFECTLFKLSMQDETNYHRTLNSRTIYKYSGLQFLDIQSMLPQNVALTPDAPIIIGSPAYVSSLQGVLKKIDDRTFHNFLVYRAVRSMLQLLNTEARSLVQYLGLKEVPRGLWCSQYTSARFERGISQLYLMEHTTPELKQQVEDVAGRLKKELQETMETHSWMDPITRAKALEKIDSMIAMYVYLDEFRNPMLIDSLYNETFYNWDPDALLFSELHYSSYDRKFLDFNENFNRFDWRNRLSKLETNSAYDAERNELSIYAPIAQFPLITVDMPNYIVYGALGFAVGHEMAHAFDSTGRQFDKDGNVVDWWQPESAAKFAEMADCFVNQYNNYSIDGNQVNGVLTLGENIADNFGVTLAYKALNSWIAVNHPEPLLPGFEKYTPKQMFWISFATTWCSKYTRLGAAYALKDVHAPNQFRIIGSITNSEDFARDFDCPVGSKMNPEKKCAGYLKSQATETPSSA